jgi:hypothetical protein
MHADRYDVEPLFDPLITNMQGNEQMLVDLEQQGIDPYACQYLGSTGCRIRWDLRPSSAGCSPATDCGRRRTSSPWLTAAGFAIIKEKLMYATEHRLVIDDD